MEHTEQDAHTVESQLGRPSRGRWSVVARCHLGVPTVIASYPRLDDGSPFPTLFWLTCPLLVKRAARLEAGGWMTSINEALAVDGGLKERLAGAIDRYVEARDGYERLEESGGPPGGGPGRVKCLHAHLAHELADPPNPVGARVLAATGWPDCRVPCVAEGTEEP